MSSSGLKSQLSRTQKLGMIQRSLGIKHKLKVYEAMKQPETHEDMSIMLLARWELEDELKAIEALLSEERELNTAQKRVTILRDGVKPPHQIYSTDSDTSAGLTRAPIKADEDTASVESAAVKKTAKKK